MPHLHGQVRYTETKAKSDRRNVTKSSAINDDNDKMTTFVMRPHHKIESAL